MELMPFDIDSREPYIFNGTVMATWSKTRDAQGLTNVLNIRCLNGGWDGQLDLDANTINIRGDNEPRKCEPFQLVKSITLTDQDKENWYIRR
jgi:hypothetical protein